MTDITRQDWDWWYSMNNHWRKWFNFYIGKPEHSFNIQDASDYYAEWQAIHGFVRDKGLIDAPTSEEFKQMVNLTVFCSFGHDDNKIKCIEPLQHLKQLQHLDLRKHIIEDINVLESLTQLQTLDLRENKIEDINALKSLTQLKTLWLNNNEITDIRPLAYLTQLQELNLAYTVITDIRPLKSLKNLQALWFPLNDDTVNQQKELKDALPNCVIVPM